MRTLGILTLTVLALALVGCAAGNGAAGSATITGTVTYLQRIALPAGATLSVPLVDISLADAPAVTLGEQSYQPETQVPLPFAVSYDASAIQDNHTYALQAEIRDDDGKLWFRNTTTFLVLTNEHPSDDVEIVLDMVSGQ